MGFAKEKDFEDALVKRLVEEHGWSGGVIEYPDEKTLIDNWAKFLFRRNDTRERLNGVPLSENEMNQILDEVKKHKTPFKLHEFINGQSVAIRRDGDSPDVEHRSKEISLEIYNKSEIASGNCCYQIARQPIFRTKDKFAPGRRGDFTLLINGMPLIHVELKASGVSLTEATNQIVKYSYEGVFTGLYSLVQIFVAMNPEETLYFVNFGEGKAFNPDYYFHWTDNQNQIMGDWQDIARHLLSIPMAHQLVGWYTVADKSDGFFKVMRPYQYYACEAIADVVRKHDWTTNDNLGGFVWHTTGSGKTLTSFKCAQRIADAKIADKVVFLLDRIELSTQSLLNYQGFKDENDDILDTSSTAVLRSRLKDSTPGKTLIVSSIQKMSRIKDEKLTETELEAIRKKRIVFVLDECHRSTFGDMLRNIKLTFPKAIFFGFTGTPVFDENEKKGNKTSDLFGPLLHKYALMHGMRDGNVLGFDPDMVLTFSDAEVKEKIALKLVGAANYTEVVLNKKVSQYNKFYNSPLGTKFNKLTKKWEKGLEAYIPEAEFWKPEYQEKVVQHILDGWTMMSKNGKFHAIFATSSIFEAIDYYRLFKKMAPELKVTALFDPSLMSPDNNDSVTDIQTEKKTMKEKQEEMLYKYDALKEIIDDYDKNYGMSFELDTHDKMKEDIGERLAHKTPYRNLAKDQQLDLLIVVNQMLTGYDSKWLNTLYLDKELKDQHLIQAFSRTNRLFGIEKPFGMIRYFRRPHTMAENIKRALEIYAGNRPEDILADKLPGNLRKMNGSFTNIEAIFKSEGIENFGKVPDNDGNKKEFVKLFKQLFATLEAAKLQLFTWKQLTYPAEDKNETITLIFDEDTFRILEQRYRELIGEGGSGGGFSIPIGLGININVIDMDLINAEYMNERFREFIKNLSEEDKQKRDEALQMMQKSFARLSAEDQKYAEIILHDLQTVKLIPSVNVGFNDYINQYKKAAKDKRTIEIATGYGLDVEKLRTMIDNHVTPDTINEFGRFDELLATVDKAKARKYLSIKLKKELKPFQVQMEMDKDLRNFVIENAK